MYFGQHGKSFALIAGFALATQAGFTANQQAPAAPAGAQAQVQQGKAALKKGQLDVAIATLTKATATLGTKPGSCDAHYALGMALCKKAQSEAASKDKALADFFAAKKELRTAIRVGKGNDISKQANTFLMTNLPKEMISPRAGEGTELIAARLGLRSTSRGIGSAAPKPKVFEFYADWCEPCTKLRPVLAKLKQQYGDQIEVQSINVDDKTNAEIVDQYDVSPIPTVIYMNTDGQVMGYSIGVSDEKLLQKELQKILPNKG